MLTLKHPLIPPHPRKCISYKIIIYYYVISAHDARLYLRLYTYIAGKPVVSRFSKYPQNPKMSNITAPPTQANGMYDRLYICV